MADQNPIETLQKAAKKVDVERLTHDRGKTHGDWLEQSALSQRFKALVYEHGKGLHPYQLEALDMISVKIARILSGDAGEIDHWDDIQGYAHLGKGGLT